MDTAPTGSPALAAVARLREAGNHDAADVVQRLYRAALRMAARGREAEAIELEELLGKVDEPTASLRFFERVDALVGT